MSIITIVIIQLFSTPEQGKIAIFSLKLVPNKRGHNYINLVGK